MSNFIKKKKKRNKNNGKTSSAGKAQLTNGLLSDRSLKFMGFYAGICLGCVFKSHFPLAWCQGVVVGEDAMLVCSVLKRLRFAILNMC